MSRFDPVPGNADGVVRIDVRLLGFFASAFRDSPHLPTAPTPGLQTPAPGSVRTLQSKKDPGTPLEPPVDAIWPRLIRAFHAAVRPAIRAFDHVPAAFPLPRWASVFALPRWALGTAIVLVLALGAWSLVHFQHPAKQAAVTEPKAQENLAARIRTLLDQPPDRFLAMLDTLPAPTVNRSAQGIAIYSPSSSTRRLQPVILWRTEPGKKYDITIVDENSRATPPWRAPAVTPPLDPSTLPAWKDRPFARDGYYRLTLQETGPAASPTTATETTFHVLPDATADALTSPEAPEAILERARLALTTEPIFYGDALAALTALATASADSVPALRIRAVALRQLGSPDPYTAVVAGLQARTIANPGHP